ncbi:ribonuclease H-like domain-containing protein [Candidatus Fermentibacteria bacterium]|nr:ribonuclease H-like domain-containing protein [Candidatus Fermentibacteria bacterium]
MSRVVIDIETVPVDWEGLEPEEQAYLLQNARTDEEQEKVRDQLGLFPLTGRVVAIGMLNPESGKALVLAEGIPGEGAAWAFDEGTEFWTGNEAEILERFWDVVKRYGQIITFNGRSFDGPYLMLRSLVLGVVASRNLVPNRYRLSEHLDLLDVLTLYGGIRRYSLDFLCRRLGIDSPKGQMRGKDVAEAYRAGRMEDIARYCLEDVRATKQLLDRAEEALGVLVSGS